MSDNNNNENNNTTDSSNTAANRNGQNNGNNSGSGGAATGRSINPFERSIHVNVASRRISIPRPRSLAQFILAPGRWAMPNIRNTSALYHRIKTNLLYFQTNYLICGIIMFFGLMILSMKTLLTGIVSAIILTIAGLFFFEHIPQARQIKQDHPTVVIFLGIVLIIVTWHAMHTILMVVGAALSPVPFYFLHAAIRSSEGLIDQNLMGGDYFVNTPVGQMMQMIGIEPRPTISE